MSFSINVSGIEQIQKKLEKLGPLVRKDAEMAVANYMLNALVNDEIPPQKHVSRATAYPETGDGFFSPKQRRWFFWAKKMGIIHIPYTRLGKHAGVSSQWFIIKQDENLVLQNQSQGAIYLYDNNRQARQLALVGWLKIGEIIMWRAKKLGPVIDRAVKASIKKAGFKD